MRKLPIPKGSPGLPFSETVFVIMAVLVTVYACGDSLINVLALLADNPWNPLSTVVSIVIIILLMSTIYHLRRFYGGHQAEYVTDIPEVSNLFDEEPLDEEDENKTI